MKIMVNNNIWMEYMENSIGKLMLILGEEK